MTIKVYDMTSGFVFTYDNEMDAFETVMDIRNTFPDGEIRIEVE